MRPVFAKILGLIVISGLLSSCAATSLVDSWRAPNLTSRKYHKLLVSSSAKNPDTRKVHEDVLAAQLKQGGIEAVASYLLIPKDEPVSRQTLGKAVQESGADAVLSIQTTIVEKRANVQPGYIDNYPGYWYPPAFPYWDMYGYYGATTFYEPPTMVMYDVATIQVNLFDAESGKLIWAGTIESTEPGKAVTVSKDIARIIIQAFLREGLI